MRTRCTIRFAARQVSRFKPIFVRIQLLRITGVVTKNCESCGRPYAVHRQEFPPSDCTGCGSQLEPSTNREGNYTYRCAKCRTQALIASLVPHWDDLFAFDGYAIENDPSKNDRPF
jgi:hypothetical protein